MRDERVAAQYRRLRIGLHVNATEALARARRYCLSSDEEHAVMAQALDVHLRRHLVDGRATCAGYPNCAPMVPAGYMERS